ncbi:MAG TPA: hypothetical protein VJ739_05935 [Gemmataceae bacterium]|nr:hypothetical protein [Gemmataceae bacterium]
MFEAIYGVDFSGARLAGRNTWVARLVSPARRARTPGYQLAELWRLEKRCGTAERAPALAHLVEVIARSERALWALDFPFGLPVEVMEPGTRWPAQLDFLHAWGENAYGAGVECLRRAQALGGPNHIRRQTDGEAKAPFDCYHYRIIYQTFYGMRDVLGPLRLVKHTAILPFQYRRLPTARRVLVEACPTSTLKRLGLPHNNYKQPEGGPLTRKRLRTRNAILAGLAGHVQISEGHRRVIMRNGGGDALDAVIAALGGIQAWEAADHRHIARHPRYPREGRLFI